MTKINNNIVKTKHFIHVKGSGSEYKDTEEFENFINSENINPIEISHSYQHHPFPCLSIFVVYADVEQVKLNAKEAVDESEKKAAPKKKPSNKKVN